MNNTSISNWMAWEGGVDLVAVTAANLPMPNVIMHVARVVHTPVGSAPSGMVCWQSNPSAAPEVMGFVSTDARVGAYFGPKIFAGTPFEKAPVLTAKIDTGINADTAWSRIEVGGFVFETRLTKLGASQLIQRAPAAMPPFWQQGVEINAGAAEFKVNGKPVPVIIPPTGISGGPAAVASPCGIYAR